MFFALFFVLWPMVFFPSVFVLWGKGLFFSKGNNGRACLEAGVS